LSEVSGIRTLKKLLNKAENVQKVSTTDWEKVLKFESRATTAVEEAVKAEARMKSVLEQLARRDDLEEVSARRQFLHSINTTTNDARRMLKKANQNSSRVEAILGDGMKGVKSRAIGSLKQANETKNRMNEVKATMDQLNNNTATLVSHLDNLKISLGELVGDLNKVAIHLNRAEEAMDEKEGEVRGNAYAHNKVIKSAVELERAEKTLSNLASALGVQDPTDVELNTLEDAVAALERQHDAEIGAAASQEMSKLEEKEEEAAYMQKEIYRLREGVENLARIRDTIPKHCHNNVRLESP